MSIGLFVWILMVIWFFGIGYSCTKKTLGRVELGGALIEYVVIFCICWRVFGAPIQG